MVQHTTSSSSSDDIKRTALVSLALTGGAVTALALAAYLAKQQGGSGRIPLGGVNAGSVESWLRNAAEKMQSGSQALLSDFDKPR